VRAVVLASLLLASPAAAHYFPGARDVVVQAEEGSVAMLVTYRPSSRTAVPAAARGLLKAMLAARAMATLKVALDGRPPEKGSLDVKLVEDPPGSGRPLLLVLMTAEVPPGARRLTVDVEEDLEPTSTRWLDRSGGRVRSSGPRPAGEPFQGRGRLVVDWR
jgi:hypothetical protein